jgi:hypothetical protein
VITHESHEPGSQELSLTPCVAKAIPATIARDKQSYGNIGLGWEREIVRGRGGMLSELCTGLVWFGGDGGEG